MRRTEHVHYGNVMCSMIRYVIFQIYQQKMTRASEPSCSLASFVLDVLARYQTRAKVLRRSGLKKNLQVLQNNLKFCLTRASSEEHNIYYCICYLLYGMMICIMSYRYTFFVAAKVLYRGYMVYIVAISVGARSFLLQYCNILISIIQLSYFLHHTSTPNYPRVAIFQRYLLCTLAPQLIFVYSRYQCYSILQVSYTQGTHDTSQLSVFFILNMAFYY